MSWQGKKKTHIAHHLCWATFSKESLPNSLTSDPQEHDHAVCNGEDSAGDPRDHSYSGFLAHATNWDALLDTAGVPTDGTPIDPLKSKQAAEQMGIPSLDEMSKAQNPHKSTGPGGNPQPSSQPSSQEPAMDPHKKAALKRRAGRGIEGDENSSPVSPPAPDPHKKAALKRRAGRGVEGEGVANDLGPSNPMDNPPLNA